MTYERSKEAMSQNLSWRRNGRLTHDGQLDPCIRHPHHGKLIVTGDTAGKRCRRRILGDTENHSTVSGKLTVRL